MITEEMVVKGTLAYLRSVNELKVRTLEQEAGPLEDTLQQDCHDAIRAALEAVVPMVLEEPLKALERAGSSEAMTGSFFIHDNMPDGEELVARITFARQAAASIRAALASPSVAGEGEGST